MANPSEILTKIEDFKTWQRSVFPRLAARRAEAFFKNNFREQGYIDKGKKPWAKRKADDRQGGAILIGKQSGLLRDAIRAVVSGQNITIENSRLYAQIHNEGGTIIQTVTAKQRAFFWAKHKEAKDRNQLNEAERFKRMALSKTLTINMPQRQFMPTPTGAIPFELGEILRGDIEKKLEALF